MVVSSVKGREYFAGRSLNEIRICRREWKFSRIESELNEKERETRKEQRKKWVNLREGLRFILFTILIISSSQERTKYRRKRGRGE